MKKIFVVLFAVLALTGCGSTKMLDTRLTCTVAKDACYADSKWGPIGISTKIADEDTKVITK